MLPSSTIDMNISISKYIITEYITKYIIKIYDISCAYLGNDII